MNILFTVCARAGSKGVKSKNSRNFLGVPIAYYTIASYLLFMKNNMYEYGRVDLALNTDSDILVEQFNNSKVNFEFIPRLDSLAGDRVAKADVIYDTLIKMENKNNIKYDIVVDLDLTSPLRTATDIKGCIDKLIEYPEAAVAYSVTHSRRQPHFNLVLENSEGYLETAIPSNFKTRQEAPSSFDMNASIYAYRREPLLNTKKVDVFSNKCVGWIMKDTAVLDIDNEEDYELMQILARYFYDTNEDLGEIEKKAKAL